MSRQSYGFDLMQGTSRAMTRESMRATQHKKNGVSLRIWDVPIRIFHWSLVVLIGTSWLSGQQGIMEVHVASGLFLLTLLLFRFLWGIVGSTTARFIFFVRSPRSVWAYLFKGLPETPVGHNPAGGLAILLLLIVLTIQVTSGLFANDDIYTQGPLSHLVNKTTSNLLTTLHKENFKILLILIGLHIFANLLYLLLKKENLVFPMITGYRERDNLQSVPTLYFASFYRAIFIFIISILLTLLILIGS